MAIVEGAIKSIKIRRSVLLVRILQVALVQQEDTPASSAGDACQVAVHCTPARRTRGQCRPSPQGTTH